MKTRFTIMILISTAATLLSCAGDAGQKEESFKYTVDEFADLKVMRYRIPGWEDLSLKQKEYAYHLSEAAKYGRDILWDQNCPDNLRIRHAASMPNGSFSPTESTTIMRKTSSSPNAAGTISKAFSQRSASKTRSSWM